MKFSEKEGYQRLKEDIQLESMDDALLNSLWNLVYNFYFGFFETALFGKRFSRSILKICEHI